MSTDKDDQTPDRVSLLSSARSSVSAEATESFTDPCAIEKYTDLEHSDIWELDQERAEQQNSARREGRSRIWVKVVITATLLVLAAIVLVIQGSISISANRLSSQASTNLENVLEVKPLADGNKRKALIVASYKSQNTSWFADVPKDWEIYRYISDDPYAKLTVPRNQAREASAYLAFLVDHYHNLPDYMVFVHGHETGWHQPEPLPMILKALDLNVLDTIGWTSLRCALWMSCMENYSMRAYTADNWLASFINGLQDIASRPEDPWYKPLPKELAVPCCAQFAVTKSQTQTKPFEFWKRLRSPLLKDMKKEYLSWNNNEEIAFEWRVGAAFEMTWHWWFGMPGYNCPNTDYCRNTVFQGKIHCDGKTWDMKTGLKTYKNITCTLDE